MTSIFQFVLYNFVRFCFVFSLGKLQQVTEKTMFKLFIFNLPELDNPIQWTSLFRPQWQSS